MRISRIWNCMLAAGLAGVSSLSCKAESHSAAPKHPTSSPIVFVGMCDASAGVALDAHRMIVANDEDNWLRVYDADRGGGPLQRLDLSRFLQVDPEEPETDLEGACRLGQEIYWITSHGRSRKGKFRRSRHNFFATRWVPEGQSGHIECVGRPYQRLLSDLVADPRLAPFRLAEASRKPPKAEGALNIEALCATPEGRLLIGFRNPIPRGHALIVPLLNPQAMIRGSRARLGDPLLIDLGGLGIREMARVGGYYLILAGHFNSSSGSTLYRWRGPNSSAPPQRIHALAFPDLNPEAIVVFPDRRHDNRLLLLSDDGTRKIQGEDCKKVPDPNLRRFRAVWADVRLITTESR